MPGLWTEPYDWTVNELVTAPLMDTHVRDNMKAVVRAGDATGLSPTTTAAEFTSTTTESSWRTATAGGNTTGWLIPAGLIGTNRLLKLIAHGDLLYNVANETLRIRVYLRDGAGTNTLLFDDTLSAQNVSANRQPWVLDLNVAALGSASSQIMFGTFLCSEPELGAPASGIGGGLFESTDLLEGAVFADDAASSHDMSAARYLDVTGTWSTVSASLALRLKYATLVLM